MRDFNHSVNILVQAYLDDTLKHSNCEACAVANLLKPTCERLNIPLHRWANAFMTQPKDGYQFVADDNQIVCNHNFRTRAFSAHEVPESFFNLRISELKLLFEHAPYKRSEYQRIEFVFETAPKGESDDEWMFNGLMAVVDVLADIHGINLEAKESAKLLFVKP